MSTRMFAFTLAGTDAKGTRWEVKGGTEISLRDPIRKVVDDAITHTFVELVGDHQECTGPYRIVSIHIDEVQA